MFYIVEKQSLMSALNVKTLRIFYRKCKNKLIENRIIK
jgi:hypothetical protein